MPLSLRECSFVAMSLSLEKIAELRLKHLEMIQAIISRTATNGAASKNFCLTITTAVCGFAISLQRPSVALLALLPIIAFAIQDAQFLRLERRFRHLFDAARKEDWNTAPSFAIDLNQAPKISIWSVLSAWSVLSFYGSLALGITIVIVASKVLYGHF